ERHLRIRQAGARILWLRLHHRAAPPTLLRIGLLRPGTDARHFEELAAIHLDVVGLPAPVTAISLEADVAEAPGDAARDLWGREPDPERRVAGLLERLRARLGPHAVHGLRSGNERRPERAWEAVQEPVVRRCRKDEEAAGVRGRPAWMLEPPAP